MASTTGSLPDASRSDAVVGPLSPPPLNFPSYPRASSRPRRADLPSAPCASSTPLPPLPPNGSAHPPPPPHHFPPMLAPPPCRPRFYRPPSHPRFCPPPPPFFSRVPIHRPFCYNATTRAPPPPSNPRPPHAHSDPLTALGLQMFALQQLAAAAAHSSQTPSPPPQSVAKTANDESQCSVAVTLHSEHQTPAPCKSSTGPSAAGSTTEVANDARKPPDVKLLSAATGEFAGSEMVRRISTCEQPSEVQRLLMRYRRHLACVSGRRDLSSTGISSPAAQTLTRVVAAAALRLAHLAAGLQRQRNDSEGTVQTPSTAWYRKEREGEVEEFRGAACKLVDEVVLVLEKNPQSVESGDLVCLIRAIAKCRIRDITKYRAVMREIQNRPNALSASEWAEVLHAVTRGLDLQSSHQGFNEAGSTAAGRQRVVGGVTTTRGSNLSMSRVVASVARGDVGEGSERVPRQSSALLMGMGGGGIGASVTTHETSFIKFSSQNLIARESDILKLDPPKIASIIRSCAKLGHKDLDLLKHLGRAALLNQKKFSPSDWSACIKIFIRFGVPLRDNCVPKKRPRDFRDWERPPPPKMPKPMSQC